MAKGFTRCHPVIAASIQNAGAFADTNILFDWTKVDAKRMSSIDGLQVIVAGTDGADQTMVGIDLFFASSHVLEADSGIDINAVPPSLGTVRAAVTAPFHWKNHLFAHVPIVAGDFNDGDLVNLNIATKSGLDIPVNGDLYVAAIAKGALDFRTTCVTNGALATDQATIRVATIDARNYLAPGDVVHDEDDRLLGTVSIVNDSTTVIMTKNLANAQVTAKKIYPLSPIKLIFQGEF